MNETVNYITEHNIFIFLIQVFLLLSLGRFFGEILRRLRQPSITGEIIVGILLGPTIFGRFFPDLFAKVFPSDFVQQNMLETVAWVGILFFLLKAGLEMDISSAWRQKGDALKLALSDIFIPMAISFLLCLFLPASYLVNPSQKLLFAFFMSTVMTISSLPITARVLNDLNLYKTDVGFLIMSALSVNDIIGWIIFTILLGLVTSSHIAFSHIAIIIVTSIGFTALCLTLGRHLSNRVILKIKEKNIPEPAGSLTYVSLMGFLCGAVTLKIGIHALFGFFLAGIMTGESRILSEKTKNIISQMVQAVFIPLFFASIGLKIDFLKNFDLFLVILVCFFGIAVRFIGAWLGVKMTKQDPANNLIISIAHTPGGEMQIVVGLLALNYNLIGEPVFVAIVSGAILSSVILGPWLSYALKKRKKVNMTDFLIRHAVIGDLKATQRDSAIMELSKLVAEHSGMPEADIIYNSVLNREQAMGTGIEESAAIPHARMEQLTLPAIAFGKSTAGIDWNSPDGKPAHFIFFILIPEPDSGFQIQILRGIANVIRDKAVRDSLMTASSSRDVYSILHNVFSAYNLTKQ